MMIQRQQKGVALLEAMIAIIVLGIGLLGTIGLQARAYSAMNDAGQRAEATIASQKLIGLMSTDVTNLASYAATSCTGAPAVMTAWCTDTIKAIPGATIGVAVVPLATGSSTAVTVTIGWQLKAGAANTANRSVMTAYLAGSS
ncbi:MAG: prepilin-type N-terminal cleavage/methylation domain-containing protein [Pseudomonadota bacterium]|nr:prepilin-type N-terminal cleavage/methylation domain-containing protein [Pseudomonadota bacterium]